MARPRHKPDRRSRIIKYRGRTGTLPQWSEWLGISQQTLYMRLQVYGWPVRKAFKKPKKFERHGLRGSVEYSLWAALIQRCTNRHQKSYRRYGGRGIGICKEWRHSFTAFLACVGKRPSPKHQLERKNNEGDYEPGNVVWALPKANSRNRRDNHLLTHDGKTLTVAEWAEITGFSYDVIIQRIYLGWTPSRALTQPPRKLKKRR